MSLRRVVLVEKKQYVVIAEDKTTMTLERMQGDFTDYRRVLGVTGKELADLLGVTQSFISKLEKGIKAVPESIKEKCDGLITEQAKNAKKRGHKSGHKMTENMTAETATQKKYSDLFYERYKLFKDVPYGRKDGDFVQLADLTKRLGELLSVELFDKAITNYFATPQKSYTLADLCVHFDTFKDSAFDRYGRPVERGNGRVATVGAQPGEGGWRIILEQNLAEEIEEVAGTGKARELEKLKAELPSLTREQAHTRWQEIEETA